MKYETIIGIDPGLQGAITVFSSINDNSPKIVDTPIYKKKTKGKANKYKNDYIIKEMIDTVSGFKKNKTIVCLEQVHAMPQQGVTSTFNFGRGLGLWEGIIYTLGYDLEIVTPQSWKKYFNEYFEKYVKLPPRPTPAMKKKIYKNAAREIAIELYPNIKDYFKLIKDSDRAESLLIAERKRRMLLNA